MRLRNLPRQWRRVDFFRFLDESSRADFDFALLHVDPSGACNSGLGTVHFRSPDACRAFCLHRHGHVPSPEAPPDGGSISVLLLPDFSLSTLLLSVSGMATFRGLPLPREWLPGFFDLDGNLASIRDFSK